MEIYHLYYLGIGMGAGFFAGLLGIGGGSLMTPLILVAFASDPSVTTSSAHLAVGTAMAIIAFTAIPSTFGHSTQGHVNFRLALLMFPGVIGGAFIGSILAPSIPESVVVIGLITFLCIVAWSMLWPKSDHKPTLERKPGKLPTIATSPVIGSLSSIVGIGGGVLLVPYLTRQGLSIHRAIGTSALLTCPLAFSAAIGYMLAEDAGDSTIGLVHIPALISITLTGGISAFIGARVAGKLPTGVLKKVFGILLLMVAANLVRHLVK